MALTDTLLIFIHPGASIAVVATDLLIAIKLNVAVPCNYGLCESALLFTSVGSNEGAHATLAVLQQ
jgi:hypothetical protein